MPKRLHIYTTEDVLKSVKEGVEVTANCGLRKTLTRGDIDEAATSDRKGCAKCLQVVSDLTKERDVTIGKRGWDALNRPVFTYRMTIKPGGNTTYTNGWPLAG
ncbi:hypothetical protein ACIP5T_03280 [Microbacterium sp. NPDC088619]|uniref:hypothetical protein n=1 Tax=Microbacterium sp. NPDC088619 TaxID=3364196 RepID=UPI00381A031D